MMCITAKEPNMYDLMRKLPIGIQTFAEIREENYPKEKLFICG